MIEVEVDLSRGQAFVVNLLLQLGYPRVQEGDHRVHRARDLFSNGCKIEGPVGEFPSPAYNRLFADVPLKAKSVARAEAEGKEAAAR